MIIDHSTYALSHRFPSEVQDQAKGLSSQPEIGQQLLCMGLADLLDGFHFKDQPILDEDVDPKRTREPHTFIVDIDRLLPVNLVTEFLQLCGKDGLIDTFEQSRSEIAMHLHGDADHISTDSVDVSHCALCVLCAFA